MPLPQPEEWIYAGFPADRLAYLDRDHPFEVILDRIVAEATPTWFDVDFGRKGLTIGAARALFIVDVSEETADLFFNARDGYRGRHWQGREIGEGTNRALIDALSPALLAYARDKLPDLCQDEPARSIEDVDTSLHARSAKAWISDEAGNGLGRPRAEAPHLVVAKWDAAVGPGAAWALAPPYGYWAPKGSAIDIKGAFLLPDLSEVVPPGKVARSEQICWTGFS